MSDVDEFDVLCIAVMLIGAGVCVNMLADQNRAEQLKQLRERVSCLEAAL